MRPYGIRELARTGGIALVRDSHPTREDAAPAVEELSAAVVGHSNL